MLKSFLVIISVFIEKNLFMGRRITMSNLLIKHKTNPVNKLTTGVT
jgi:hypothetical protein